MNNTHDANTYIDIRAIGVTPRAPIHESLSQARLSRFLLFHFNEARVMENFRAILSLWNVFYDKQICILS